MNKVRGLRLVNQFGRIAGEVVAIQATDGVLEASKLELRAVRANILNALGLRVTVAPNAVSFFLFALGKIVFIQNGISVAIGVVLLTKRNGGRILFMNCNPLNPTNGPVVFSHDKTGLDFIVAIRSGVNERRELLKRGKDGLKIRLFKAVRVAGPAKAGQIIVGPDSAEIMGGACPAGEGGGLSVHLVQKFVAGLIASDGSEYGFHPLGYQALFSEIPFLIGEIFSFSTFQRLGFIVRKMKNSTIIKQAMSLLGRRKSAAKSTAARLNGAKGGRPVTKKDSSVGP